METTTETTAKPSKTGKPKRVRKANTPRPAKISLAQHADLSAYAIEIGTDVEGAIAALVARTIDPQSAKTIKVALAELERIRSAA